MRILEERRLLSKLAPTDSAFVEDCLQQIRAATDSVRWPPGAPDFAIRPESGKKRGQGSGVKPIRDAFVVELRERSWDIESRFPLDTPEGHSNFGKMDASRAPTSTGRPFVVEWETGNISSSHRAMNKMAIGLMTRAIVAGVLIVPSTELAKYLTDRVGNIRELRPYEQLWSRIPISSGYLSIVVVEHDRTDPDVPRIKKGTDGRSLA